MKEHIIQTVPQWKYVLNAVSACKVTSKIDGRTVTLAHLPNGGSACFYANSPHVSVQTEAPFEVFPCSKDYSILEQIQTSAVTTTPIKAAVAEEQAKGSEIHTMPAGAYYTVEHGSTLLLDGETEILDLTPSALTTAQEMRVLYTPAEARTTPLIAVPQGVTLHWAGDEEPNWEAGTYYVIQLLQTSPTHIEARLFNEPQGAKLPGLSEENARALAVGDVYTAWPQYTDAEVLYINQALPEGQPLLNAKVIVSTGPLKGSLNAPNADFYCFNASGVNAYAFNVDLHCRNYTWFCTAGAITNWNAGYLSAKVTGVFRLLFPNLEILLILGSFATRKAVHEARIYLPNVKYDLRICSKSGAVAGSVSQPLTAESIIYCFSNLRDLTLLPPDSAGNPVTHAISIGIDETLGAIDPADGRWKPTHSGVIAATEAAERKNWVVAFEPTEP